MTFDNAKVYFPVESLVGLGHFSRAGNLVREMVRSGLATTVASGTFVDPGRFFSGADQVSLPPHLFLGRNGRHYALQADGKRTLVPDFNAASFRIARVRTHMEAVNALRPDALVSEFWPFDRPQFDNEMCALIHATDRDSLQKKCARFVSVRDVLNQKDDTVDAGSQQARDLWATDMINRHFDAVLVHGDPRLITLSETFSAADEIKKDIIYTGYVLNDMPERLATDPHTGRILVSCGAGATASDMIFSFLTAWQKLLERKETDPQAAFATNRPLHIICGPRFMQEYFLEVMEWAEILKSKYATDITVEKYRPDFTSLLASSAFSVSLAGYNTTLETLALQVPGLFVPSYSLNEGTLHVNTEQVYRLKRLEQSGMASFAMPEEVENSTLFAKRLSSEMVEQLSRHKTARPVLDFSGAKKAVETIRARLAPGR